MSAALGHVAPLLERIMDLPALPRAALEAMQVLRDEDSPHELCVELIGRDPALAARTLKIANSVFYGMPGRVWSLRDAVILLGRRPIASLVTALVVDRQFPAAPCNGFDFTGFWRHATASAIAARAIARAVNHDDELAFTAGLLCDIGMLAMASQMPGQFEPVLATARAQDRAVHEVEADLLGVDHAAVGAAIARRWQLGEALSEAIAGHHGSTLAAAGRSSLLVHITHAADAVAHALDLAGQDQEQVPVAHLPSWSALDLSCTQLLSVLDETERQSLALCQALAA